MTDTQIDELQLPTRPAKKSDPEAHKWGARAVELDAIPPDELQTLVHDSIVSLVDAEAWRMEQAVEQSEREILKRMVAT